MSMLVNPIGLGLPAKKKCYPKYYSGKAKKRACTARSPFSEETTLGQWRAELPARKD